MSTLSILLNSNDVPLKAFEFASGLSNQLISLAIGILAIWATFGVGKLGASKNGMRRTAIWAWIFYLISIIAGILHQMSLTGLLRENTLEFQPFTTLIAQIQVIFFVIATLFFLIYAIRMFKSKPAKVD